MHQTQYLGTARIEALSGQRVATYVTQAHGRYQLRENDGRRHAPARLADGEGRATFGDHNVTGSDDAGATADAEAMHQRDRRFGHFVQTTHGLGGSSRGGVIGGGIHVRQCAQPGKIGARLEMGTIATDHHHAHLRIARQPPAGVDQRCKELGVVSVVQRRAIQGHGRDATDVDGTQYDGLAHADCSR